MTLKAKRQSVPVSQDEYLEATESYMGWCPDCAAFTRDSTEPDAHGYDCPECNGRRVVGAEDALLRGLIWVDGREE